MTDLHRPDLTVGAWPGLPAHRPTRLSRVGEVWSVPRIADEVASARHHIRELAAKAIGYGNLAGDVELMASELLTNAVDHGAGETMLVRVIADRRMVRVEVCDSGTESVVDPQAPELLSEQGRGLFIVAAFATTWGLCHAADGTTAWFELVVS